MEIKQLIKDLAVSDLIAQCPMCNNEFKLADTLLFDGTKKFPSPAEERKQLLLNELMKREKELGKRKISVDVTAEKRAVEVGFGKIIEKFIPAYKDLKLQFCECRPLYEPIDVIVFNGLLKRKVDLITFLEIKSGSSSLNRHQRIIKDAVLEGKVALKVL